MQIYLSSVPTTDPIMLTYVDAKLLTLTKYKDVIAKNSLGAILGRWPWHVINRPDRRYKRLHLNCINYSVVWCDTLEDY
jgi:hypothetical protein